MKDNKLEVGDSIAFPNTTKLHKIVRLTKTRAILDIDLAIVNNLISSGDGDMFYLKLIGGGAVKFYPNDPACNIALKNLPNG